MKSEGWPRSGFYELIFNGVKTGKSTGEILRACQDAGHKMRSGKKLTTAYIGATINNRKMRTAKSVDEVNQSGRKNKRGRGVSSALKQKMIMDVFKSAQPFDVRETKIAAILAGRITKPVDSIVQVDKGYVSVVGQSITSPDIDLPAILVDHLPVLFDALPELEKLLKKKR